MHRRDIVRTTGLVTIAALGGMTGTAQAGLLNGTTGANSGRWGGTKIFVGTNTRVAPCTAGFAASNGGGKFMVTAGHCSQPGTSVFAALGGDTTSNSAIGTLVGINVNPFGGDPDFAAYYNGGVKGYQNAAGYQLKVTGVMDAVTALNSGKTACYTGGTTGYNCGRITAAYGDTVCIGGPGVAVDYGDSGSAIWVDEGGGNVQIVGLVDRKDNCGTTATKIMSAYGATPILGCSS